MQLEKKKPAKAFDPLISLINISFLLLIFFLLTGVIAERPEGFNLPQITSSDSAVEAGALTLVLDDEGLKLGGVPFSPFNLEGVEKITLFADRDLPAERLLQALRELRSLGAEEIELAVETGR